MTDSLAPDAIPGLAGNRWSMTAANVAALPQVPKHLVVIGSDTEAIELAKKYAAQGAPVTLLEAAPGLAAARDASSSMTLASELTRLGVKVRTGAQVVKVEDLGEAAAIEFREGLNAVARIFADAVVAP